MTTPPRNAGPEAVAVVVASLVVGAAWAWFAGEDANWDWQNYHEYDVWALLTGRYAVDVAPAGLQTYFNPIIYLPAYWLRHAIAAPFGAVIMGAVHGLNLALVYALTRLLLGAAATVTMLAASLLIAATGATALSEVGTSLSDILTALPVIGGVIFLLKGGQARSRDVIVAGLLLGAAVGFKLTNVVFALGAAAALLVSARPLLSLLCLALGGAVGAALCGGAWSLMLWRELGNPVFPLFNAVFHSAELADINILDLTFTPRGFWDGVAYPFYTLIGDHRTTEVPMRDARFALLAALVPIAIAAGIRRRAALFSRMDWQLFVFVAVSYLVWLVVFSIQRYIVALDLLCGPVVVVMLARLLPGPQPEAAPGGGIYPAGIASIGIALALGLWGQPADWWHRPWSTPYRPEPLAAALRQPATYFLLDKPVAYLAPRFPAASRFYQLADIGLPIIPDGTFDRRIRTGLAAPLPGGVWALVIRGKARRDDLLARYGLGLDRARPCVEVDGVLRETIEACPLAPLPTSG